MVPAYFNCFFFYQNENVTLFIVISSTKTFLFDNSCFFCWTLNFLSRDIPHHLWMPLLCVLIFLCMASFCFKGVRSAVIATSRLWKKTFVWSIKKTLSIQLLQLNKYNCCSDTTMQSIVFKNQKIRLWLW